MLRKQFAGVGITPSKTELGKFVRDRRLELGLYQVPINQLIFQILLRDINCDL